MSAQCRTAVTAATVVFAAGIAFAQSRPAPSPLPAGAAPTPTFSETVLEITPAVLDRLAKALAAENGARAAAPAPAATPAARKTPKEYEECQQGLVRTPEYAQLTQQYAGAVSGKAKDPATREAAEELMAKLAALALATCGPDPSGTREKQELANRLREAQARAAEGNGFTIRQYAILKERVAPLCLADPEPPNKAGMKVKGFGNASFVFTASEVKALRPRCDAFIKLLYPDES